MTEIIRNKYKSEICEKCNGYGYVRFRNGGDEECFACDGGGMTYEEDDNL